MRKSPRHYIVAAIIFGAIGALTAETGTLLGGLIGIGVGLLVVLFWHSYPRVGYAEKRIEPPTCTDRRIGR
ncbi:MAG: hypothetical protein KGJ79_15635 [Alphaproteobacteria bacterium]|nr:hypothetical protein [Alphaproteobacteria bacterium]MDE2112573.1 hypothetical protein [Alphaproteobacteria bacterium]MDE2492878.1 hypothetical protein [Alphaproteobacteria bacterium]